MFQTNLETMQANSLPFAGSHLVRPNHADSKWIYTAKQSACWRCGVTTEPGARIYWQSAKTAHVRDSAGKMRSPTWCVVCANALRATPDPKGGTTVDPMTLKQRFGRSNGNSAPQPQEQRTVTQYAPTGEPLVNEDSPEHSLGLDQDDDSDPLGIDEFSDDQPEAQPMPAPKAPIQHAHTNSRTHDAPQVDALTQAIAAAVRGALQPQQPPAPSIDSKAVEKIAETVARRLDLEAHGRMQIEVPKLAGQIFQNGVPVLQQRIDDTIRAEAQKLETATTALDARLAKVESTNTATHSAAEMRKLAHEEAAAALVVAVGKTPAQDASQLASVGIVPSVAPEYVSTETGALIRYCLESGHHALISGPSGSGKTYPIEQEAARLGRAVVKISCADGLQYRALVVGEELVRDAQGSTVTRARYGALPLAMRAGCVLILDEADKIQPELAAVFHSALETPIQRASLHVPQTGETIAPAPGFILFATSNMVRDTSGLHSGHRIDAAFLNRCRHIPADYLDAKQEQSIIEKAGANSKLAAQIVDFLARCRAHYVAGNMTTAPSTRVGVVLAQMLIGLAADGVTKVQPLQASAAVTLTLAGALPPAEAQLVRDAATASRLGA